MKVQEIKNANELLEKYGRFQVEIEKASCLNVVTLCYSGHRSHEMRGKDIDPIKVSLIKSCEEQASSLLSQLVIAGVDIGQERGRLQALVARALKGPINEGEPLARRGEPV